MYCVMWPTSTDVMIQEIKGGGDGKSAKMKKLL